MNNLIQLKQQRFHTVGVHHFFARRPSEDGEATVLRGHERDGIMLVLNELGSRQMSSPTKLERLNNRRYPADNRLCYDNLLDPTSAVTAADLRTERKQFILIAD